MTVSSSGRLAEDIVDEAPTSGFRGIARRVHWREIVQSVATISLRTSGRYHRALDLFAENESWPALCTSLAPEVAIWEMVSLRSNRSE